MALPVQAFQIGQRVRKGSKAPFVIRAMFLGWDEILRYGSNNGYDCFEANELTLAPERPPYVPSERRVVPRKIKMGVVSLGYTNEAYRPETDAEMDDRHTVERAKYDAQGEGE